MSATPPPPGKMQNFFTFLGDWPDDKTNFLLFASRLVIVKSAVAEKLIRDEDLAMVPEVMGVQAHIGSICSVCHLTLETSWASGESSSTTAVCTDRSLGASCRDSATRSL